MLRNSGFSMPVIAFGAAGSAKSSRSLREAMDVGFRAIDTATRHGPTPARKFSLESNWRMLIEYYGVLCFLGIKYCNQNKIVVSFMDKERLDSIVKLVWMWSVKLAKVFGLCATIFAALFPFSVSLIFWEPVLPLVPASASVVTMAERRTLSLLLLKVRHVILWSTKVWKVYVLPSGWGKQFWI